MEVFVKFLLCLTLASAGYCEDCGDSVGCEEKKLAGLIEELDKPSISILGDAVRLERIGDFHSAPRSEEGLVERTLRYLQSHELKIRMPGSAQEAVRSLVSEARKSKLKRVFLPLLLLLKLKTFIIIPTALFAIALLAVKGVSIGFTSLLIASALGLKSLFEKHGSSSSLSYEIVPPIPSAHWSRNGVEWNPVQNGYQ